MLQIYSPRTKFKIKLKLSKWQYPVVAFSTKPISFTRYVFWFSLLKFPAHLIHSSPPLSIPTHHMTISGSYLLFRQSSLPTIIPAVCLASYSASEDNQTGMSSTIHSFNALSSKKENETFLLLLNVAFIVILFNFLLVSFFSCFIHVCY